METNRSDKARLSLLLPTELRERLARYAARQGISKSEAARRALDAGLTVLERPDLPDLDEQLESPRSQHAISARRCARAMACTEERFPGGRGARGREAADGPGDVVGEGQGLVPT